MKITLYSQPGNQGFTLLEVLVAIVILSIGLLAVAGMQTQSMRSSGNALYRSQAVLGCEDILDRMRANIADAQDGDYDLAMADATPATGGIADNDLNEWRNALATNLPAGNGSVVRSLTGDITTVTVEWRDSFGPDSVVMETRLW